MNRRVVIAGMIVFAAIVLAACSSNSPDTVASTAADNAVSTIAASDPPGSDTTLTEPVESTTTTIAVEPVIKGAVPIEQTTPTSGEGPRPLLEWIPIDGAALYIVTMYTDTGGPYWSAVTAETSTYVGGPLQIPAGRTGPNVAEGYTWVVYAEDADGNLLAVSPQRAIAP
jgi:hypothetical protein